MSEIVIDAKGCTAGRLASRVAKEVLNGRRVCIINAEEAVISGSPAYVIGFYTAKVRRGDPYKGPFYPRTPERILRRIVRGMLPKKARGREALRRLRVFRGFPEEYKKANVQRFEDAKRVQHKSVTLKKLAYQIGGVE